VRASRHAWEWGEAEGRETKSGEGTLAAGAQRWARRDDEGPVDAQADEIGTAGWRRQLAQGDVQAGGREENDAWRK